MKSARLLNSDVVQRLALQNDDQLSARALLRMGAIPEESCLEEVNDEVPLLEQEHRKSVDIESTIKEMRVGKPRKAEEGDNNSALDHGCRLLSLVDIEKLSPSQLTKLNSWYATQLQRTMSEIKKRSIDIVIEEEE